MMKKARNLKNSILSEPKEKTVRPISDELKQAVKHFYESMLQNVSKKEGVCFWKN